MVVCAKEIHAKLLKNTISVFSALKVCTHLRNNVIEVENIKYFLSYEKCGSTLTQLLHNKFSSSLFFLQQACAKLFVFQKIRTHEKIRETCEHGTF